MKTRKLLIGVLGFILVCVAGILAYRHWHSEDAVGAREELLSLLPGDPSTVVFVDLDQLRKSAFLPQLLSLVPRDSMDEDYAQFVKSTGFNYERDLDRVAVAMTNRVAHAVSYGIAEGRFDRKKLEDYAKQSAQTIDAKGMRVYSVNLKKSNSTSYFTFLRDNRIAWSNDPAYADLFRQAASYEGKRDWQEHFTRLSGSAVFAVLREDSATATAIQQQAPGGFRSPQLATLLDQLQWVTIGGKPEENDLRVVIEGESASESALNQLKEFLQGLLVMAQAGLNGPQGRKQMDAQMREAYLELLNSANVEKVDRGKSKSIRLVFDVTPGFLAAVKTSSDSHPAKTQ